MSWIMMHMHRELVLRLFGILGSWGSVVALAIGLDPGFMAYGLTRTALAVLSTGLLAFVVILELRGSRRKHVIPVTKGHKIRDYMFRWIQHAGRVAIFSRDLSWVDSRMRGLLRQKAQDDELLICLPKSINLTDELKRAGATIFTYESLKHVPESRFTIVNHGRGDAQVAVGQRCGSMHVIEELSASDHPAFHMAQDLVNLVTRFGDNAGSSGEMV